jgi:hypothetical protein
MIDTIIIICTGILAVTAVITLAALINIVPMQKEYLSKLFYALILQIVVYSTGAFGAYLQNEDIRSGVIRLPTSDSQVFQRRDYIVSHGRVNKVTINLHCVDVSRANQKVTLDFSLPDHSAHEEMELQRGQAKRFTLDKRTYLVSFSKTGAEDDLDKGPDNDYAILQMKIVTD